MEALWQKASFLGINGMLSKFAPSTKFVEIFHVCYYGAVKEIWLTLDET